MIAGGGDAETSRRGYGRLLCKRKCSDDGKPAKSPEGAKPGPTVLLTQDGRSVQRIYLSKIASSAACQRLLLGRTGITHHRPVTPIRIPKGAELHVDAHYNNATANKINSNPNQTLYISRMTWEETMAP